MQPSARLAVRQVQPVAPPRTVALLCSTACRSRDKTGGRSWHRAAADSRALSVVVPIVARLARDTSPRVTAMEAGMPSIRSASRLIEPLQKLPRIEREALDVSPLAFGVERVQCQARFAAAADAAQHDQLVMRNIEVHALQIVDGDAAQLDIPAVTTGRLSPILCGILEQIESRSLVRRSRRARQAATSRAADRAIIAACRRRKPTNPFYVAASSRWASCLRITACAYVVMTCRASIRTAGNERGLSGLMEQHGLVIMVVELAILGVLTVAAIGSDDFWTRRFEAARSGSRQRSRRSSHESQSLSKPNRPQQPVEMEGARRLPGPLALGRARRHAEFRDAAVRGRPRRLHAAAQPSVRARSLRAGRRRGCL